jgi:hypothetical protein
MKNLYTVVGDEVHITINRKISRTDRRPAPPMIARVSLNKLPMLQSTDHCWVAHKSKRDLTHYIQARIGGTGPITSLHRMLLGLNRPGMSKYHVDHEDNDGTNNTDANLRITNPRGNALNRRTAKTDLSGVRQDGSRWVANVGIGKQRKKYLGSFATQEEASSAYQEARIRLISVETVHAIKA